MNRTCVVIVNWNSWPLTRACLETVAAQTRPAALTVVVDNASRDLDVEAVLAFVGRGFKRPAALNGSAAEVLPPGADFVLARQGRNLGWGAGNNAALDLAATRNDLTGFLFVNPDALLAPDCLQNLEDHLDTRPDVGIAGATVLRGLAGDTLECAAGCRYLGFATVVRPALAGFDARRAQTACEPRIDYVLGACMYVRRSVFEQTGPFDAAGLVYYEEADLCLRARRAGWKLGWCRRAAVRHIGGGGLAQALPDERERKRLANYHENLGALRFAWKNHRATFPLALTARVLGKLAVLAWRGEGYLAAELFAAVRDFFRTGPVTCPGREPCPAPRGAWWRGR